MEENDLPNLKFLLRFLKNTVIQCSQVNKLSGRVTEKITIFKKALSVEYGSPVLSQYGTDQ